MATEKRLIDANALLEAVEDLRCGLYGYADYNAGVDDAVYRVESAPTVDAVEVVHSQWDTVFYERNGTLASYSHLCPECKYFYKDVRFKGHNYCPDCGAKMDGGGQDG